MKIFECSNCCHPLYFENTRCERCGHHCGFLLTAHAMLTFEHIDAPIIPDQARQHYRYCQNHAFGVCNWLVPAGDEPAFCEACALNRTIPNLSDHENFEKWQKLEVAKHRLVYQLARLKLPLSSKMVDQTNGLCFDFISRQGDSSIMTGHADGVITILLSEADSVHRELMRTQMSEPYRTLIGHFRHEVGHYYWDQLLSPIKSALDSFRELFGDEKNDYAESLARYYQNKAPSDWQQRHISEYATAHPWEDWAESWAHYLHIMDMAETAYFFGVSVHPRISSSSLQGVIEKDPYEVSEFEDIFNPWMPVSLVINSLNRSMGIPDAYPFVVSPPVVEKMKFIHDLIRNKNVE
jgi:hypothetical protein